MTKNILIVEDDEGIREAISVYMKQQGYHPILCSNGEEGLEAMKLNTIHLAIVDIMMPVMDGIEMTLHARKLYDFPIIFLSAKSEDIDKITGLNIGADDYVTKPFGSMELIARVKSHLRRYDRMLAYKENNQQETSEKTRLQVGLVELDTQQKKVWVEDVLVHLTPKEFSILELFMNHPNHVLSAEQIYETVWREAAINTETIMVHIRKLREKIEVDPKNPQYIKVVWGVGYILEGEVTS